RGRARDGHRLRAHPAPPRAAQHILVDRRAVHAAGGAGDLARGRAVVPRRGLGTDVPDVGSDDRPRPRLRERGVVAPDVSRPRYLAAYELDDAGVLQSPAWKAAGEAGRWPGEIRPHTMNRHLAVYEWVGGRPELTGRTPYIFWVMMDVEPHREALFNELYDTEHLPLLLKLPGCVNAVRYRTSTAGG